MSTPGRCALVLAIVVLVGLTSAQMDGAGQDDLRAGQNDRLESQEPAEASAPAFRNLEIAPAMRTFPRLETAPDSNVLASLWSSDDESDAAGPADRSLSNLNCAPRVNAPASNVIARQWSSDDESDAAGPADRSLSNLNSAPRVNAPDSNVLARQWSSDDESDAAGPADRSLSNLNCAPRVNAQPEIEIDNTMSWMQTLHLEICMDGGCVQNGVYRNGCPVFALWRSKNGKNNIMQPGCIIESREKEKGPIEFMIQWLDGDSPQLVNRQDVYFRDESTMYPYTNFDGSGPVFYDNAGVVPVPSAAASRGVGGSASRGVGGSASRGVGGSASRGVGGSAPHGLAGSASLGLGGSARLGLGGSARQGLAWTESQSLGESTRLGLGGSARQGLTLSESHSLGGSGGMGLRQGSAFSAKQAMGASAPRALGGSARQNTLAKSKTSDQVRQRNRRNALRGTVASSSLSAGVQIGAASGGSAARGSLSSTGAQAMPMPMTTIVITDSSDSEAEPALQGSAQAAESGEYQQVYEDFEKFHSTRRSNRREPPPSP